MQSINGGRVAPDGGALPRLGQQVKAGDVLAMVQPALPLADRSTIAERVRELEGNLLLAEQKLPRVCNRLAPNTTPRSQIDDIELEIENLKKRIGVRDRPRRMEPETLRAPIDGVISVARAVAGQVVQPQDVLFQIVDPKGFWVEALVYDEIDPGAIAGASARDARWPDDAAPSRASAAPAAAGRHVHFAIENPPALDRGRPAGHGLMQKAEAVTGHHRAARRGRARRQRRGRRVGATGPGALRAAAGADRAVRRQRAGHHGRPCRGARVVVHGAELINQIR